uniref:Odorant receptor n=1 Tax=Sirex nitobei TaxID=1602346 RepID=A0A857N5B4_9HYME|nr:odorant receptor 36 [Sirex nitobei]
MTENSIEFSSALYDKYTNSSKRILRIVYLWPKTDGKDPFCHRFLGFLYIFNVLFCVTCQIYRVCTISKDLSNSLEILGNSTTCFVLLSRGLVFFTRSDTIRKIDTLNRKIWIEEFQDELNREMMTSAARTADILTNLLYYLVLFCSCNFYFAPVISICSQWLHGVAKDDFVHDLPFLIFSNVQDPLYNAIAYVFLSFSAIIVLCYISGVDSCYLVWIQHTRLHIKLLQQDFFRLRQSNDVRRDLRVCVFKHNRIYRNVALINDIYGPIILSLYVFNTLSMCMVLFNIVIMKGGASGNFSLYVSYFIVEISSVLLYCYYGNKIIDESVDLCFAAYDIDWYEDRPNKLTFCNCICIIMIRAQKPVVITACKLADVSLSALTSILKFMLSCFTLLKRLYED